jgi:hypothetical protein
MFGIVSKLMNSKKLRKSKKLLQNWLKFFETVPEFAGKCNCVEICREFFKIVPVIFKHSKIVPHRKPCLQIEILRLKKLTKLADWSSVVEQVFAPEWLEFEAIAACANERPRAIPCPRSGCAD